MSHQSMLLSTTTTTTSSLGVYNTNEKGSYKKEVNRRVNQLFQNHLCLIVALATLTLPIFFIAWPLGYIAMVEGEETELNGQISKEMLDFLRTLKEELPAQLTHSGFVNTAFERAKNRFGNFKLLFKDDISDTYKYKLISLAYNLNSKQLKNISCANSYIKNLLKVANEEFKTFEKAIENSINSFNKKDNLQAIQSKIEKDIKDFDNFLPGTDIFTEIARSINPITIQGKQILTKEDASKIRKNENETSPESNNDLEEAMKTTKESINNFIKEIASNPKFKKENENLLKKIIMVSLGQTIPNCISRHRWGHLNNGQKLILFKADDSDRLDISSPTACFQYDQDNGKLTISYCDDEGRGLTILSALSLQLIPNLYIRTHSEITIDIQNLNNVSYKLFGISLENYQTPPLSSQQTDPSTSNEDDNTPRTSSDNS